MLDAFRGLAALCVVMYHMHIDNSFTELEFFRGSFAFVELFFVLSGFVLAHGYGQKKELGFASFFRARFFRLYPLHFVMFLAFLMFELSKLAVAYLTNYQFTEPAFSGARAVSEIAPNLLLLQSWLPFADSQSFNAPSWSISVEFYLYFLLFFSLKAPLAIRYVLWTILPVAAEYMLVSNSSLLSNEALRGLIGFFGGVLMYLLYKRIEHFCSSGAAKLSWFATLLELLALLAIVVAVQTSFAYKELVTSCVFLLVILLFSFEAGGVSLLLKRAPFQYLGRISYSIYLTHVMILLCISSSLIALQHYGFVALTKKIDSVLFISSGSDLLNNVMPLVILSLVVWVSHYSYRHIEERWRSSSN